MTKITTAEQFGKTIRAKRNKLGYTQSELAGYCNCSVMFLSDLERGKPTAELGKAIKVMNTLGIDLIASDRSEVSS